ncbi:MAG: amidohydrolase family protein [Clostridia bacterium]|nr:amidohydrolase family protein [Clostridia bacterium]
MENVKNIKKIDIHAHANPNKEFSPALLEVNEKILSPEEVIEIYDKINVETGVLLPLVDPACQPTIIMTSEDCKRMSDASNGRFAWFCNVSPYALTNTPDADLSYLLNHYKSLGAKGVGEVTTQLFADDPMMDNLFGHCAKCDMPVIIHIAPKVGGYYGIVDDLHLPRIEKMLKKHPDMKLIGHSQCFWSEISSDVTDETRMIYPQGNVKDGTIARLMREYGNLHCDLSAGSGANAMMRDREYAARFMEEFADRIYYGCDICVSISDFQYRFSDFLIDMVKDGYLTKENYIKIVRNNAAKLLGLEEYKGD